MNMKKYSLRVAYALSAIVLAVQGLFFYGLLKVLREGGLPITTGTEICKSLFILLMIVSITYNVIFIKRYSLSICLSIFNIIATLIAISLLFFAVLTQFGCHYFLCFSQPPRMVQKLDSAT